MGKQADDMILMVLAHVIANQKMLLEMVAGVIKLTDQFNPLTDPEQRQWREGTYQEIDDTREIMLKLLALMKEYEAA